MNANQQRSRSNADNEFDKIKDGLLHLTGELDVSLHEFMTDKFIAENTDFNTLAEFFKAAGVKSKEDLQKKSFDDFIKSHTCFEDWEGMLIKSSNQYILDYF